MMKTLFICAISALINIGSARKYYDVEAVAMKLYKEDFSSVLLRFRKSTEYKQILKDKVDGMILQLNHLINQAKFRNKKKMYEKIMNDLNMTNVTIETLLSILAFIDRNFLWNWKAEKSNANVSNLDDYPKLHPSLPTADMNYFKALGFEYAGRSIHTIIKHMGPDDTPARSTQLPYGGNFEKKIKSTTQHDYNHQVMTSFESKITVTDVVPEIASTGDTLRHSNNKVTA